MGACTEIYFSYANDDQEDKKMRDGIEKQLALLVRQGTINIWYLDKIEPGRNTQSEINAHLDRAHIILLLISDSFISSSECMEQAERAMGRYEADGVRVLPILLRPVDWESGESAKFGKLAPLPTNREFITRWQDQDEALLNVAGGIRRVVQEIERGTEGAEDAPLIEKTDLYETLVRLDFRDQGTLFQQFRSKQQKKGAFLIHGAPSYGQIWLLNQLIWQLPARSTIAFFPFSFQRRARGRSIQDLWAELATSVELSNTPSPIDATTQQEIIRRLCKRWQTRTVILMLNNLHEIEEQYIDKFLQDFWQTFAAITKDAVAQSSKHFFLMFLIDHDDRVDKWSVPLAKQVDPAWEPRLPLKLKKLAEFSETVLEDWILREKWRLPPDLMAKDILAQSDGIPEEALDYICERCGYDEWRDLVKYR